MRARIKLKATRVYQEDIKRKLEANKKANEPVVEVKDQFGRVIDKIVGG